MSQNTQATPQIIELVRIRQWYVPANSASYGILRSINVPKLKIHKEFLPTLKLATSIRGIKARSTDFSSILETRLEKIGVQWKSRRGRTCRLTDKRLQFLAPNTEKNRKAIAALDTSFSKFCVRWGFKYIPLYSEVGDRIKLVVDYEFDPERNPIIDNADRVQPTSHEIVLGFTKIKVTFNDVPHGARAMPSVTHLEIFEMAGTLWRSVHTGTFVDQQIGELEPFLAALGNLFDRRKIHD